MQRVDKPARVREADPTAVAAAAAAAIMEPFGQVPLVFVGELELTSQTALVPIQAPYEKIQSVLRGRNHTRYLRKHPAQLRKRRRLLLR